MIDVIKKTLKWDSFDGMIEWCDTNAGINAFTKLFNDMVAEYSSSGESEALFTGIVVNEEGEDAEVKMEILLYDDDADPYTILKGFAQGSNTAGLMQYLNDNPRNHVKDAAIIILDFFRENAVKERQKRGV